MNIVDLSVYRKEPIIVKSLTGEEFKLDGNFSTEFYLYLYDAYSKIQKMGQDDYSKAIEFLKEVGLEIIKLDKSKNPTMDTIDEQFDDINVLMALITETMKYADDITKDPS